MSSDTRSLSRRGLLEEGAARGRRRSPRPEPRRARRARRGRRHRPDVPRAVSRGTGPKRTTLQDVKLRGHRRMCRATEATTSATERRRRAGNPGGAPSGRTRRRTPLPSAARWRAPTPWPHAGHGGIGVVEAVDRRRARAGRRPRLRVGHAAVRLLLSCLRGRADICQLLGATWPRSIRWPICATARRSTPTRTSAALSELMVTWESRSCRWCRRPATWTSAWCAAASAWRARRHHLGTLATLAPGSAVAVVGCGPLGLSAVQVAHMAALRSSSASIPSRTRRDVAMKVGATTCSIRTSRATS